MEAMQTDSMRITTNSSFWSITEITKDGKSFLTLSNDFQKRCILVTEIIAEDPHEKEGEIHGIETTRLKREVERMKREMNAEPTIIATGGLAPLIAGVSLTIETVDQSLTLDGLRIISEEI